MSDDRIPLYENRFPDLPRSTIPRPRYIDRLTPFGAGLAVSSFVGAPQSTPRWELERFHIAREEAITDYLRSFGDGKGRWSGGYGDYIKLLRLEPGGGDEGGTAKVLVMSNTPQEVITDHQHALTHGTGRVLIHGLGLSCVVSALLAKPDVEHIDVVEIEADIIEMVGSAYDDEPRVTIHHGNCLGYGWAKGTRWNYVWHDIWSEIDWHNLSDDSEAEWGISYQTMHRKFANRCDLQGSWGFLEARKFRARRRRETQRQFAFALKWPQLDVEDRVAIMFNEYHRKMFAVPGIIQRPSRDQNRAIAQRIGLFKTWRQIAEREKEAPSLRVMFG